jgi:hypothetical protein
MSTQNPLARKDQLVVRELADEVLIYDLTRNKAFCLNQVAGAVWKQSDGQKSAGQIAEDLSQQLGATIEEQAVWTAVEQLGRDNLLEYCIPTPTGAARVTRRAQLKSLAKAAAIAGPIVASLAIPQKAFASCLNSGVNQNGSCTASKCCSGSCKNVNFCN